MGHFYDIDGNPRYTVPNVSKGGERDTTVSDAKKLKLFPSVTTITNVPDKPGLIAWKTNQVLQAASEFPYKKSMDYKAWAGCVLGNSDKKRDKSADNGTQIHDALEQYIKEGKLIGKNGEKWGEFVIPVIEALNERWPNAKWIAEDSFYFKGFGGKIDLYAVEGVDIPVIVDFKTKENDEKTVSMIGYDEQAMQLGAYQWGLNFAKAECCNLFISTETPGIIKFVDWTSDEIDRGIEMFEHLKRFWYLKNKIDYHLHTGDF